METPPFNPEPTNRIMTRSVLAEIPTRLGRLSMTDPNQGRTDHHVNIMNTTIANMPTSMMTPSPSPDELIIQQRGRRKIPVTFSPDIDSIKQNNQETPTKSSSSILNKSSIVLRSTPRKRLLLNDPLELSSPDKYKISSPNCKKFRTEFAVELPEDNCILSALKALSPDQLIGVIGQIVIDHPEIEKEIRSHFPIADLKPLEERIYYLRRNIYKALPSSRLISKTDSTAYNRVSTHVLAFKKCVVDQGRRLVDSNQWSVVMDYVFMAWKHVRNTPVWDNPPHNAARRQCFKSLSALCMTALKHMKESLDLNKLENYKSQLKLLVDDSEDIESCLEFLNYN
ncbi:uncharacterized protein LOC126894243 [Daktulosphaira vitifoliae]|uniref:uncharacterized protein LOC126894243 n=2 Tax=Daktulosphaira vitifoliae TaxID=58002 RepID=UPI0021A9B0D6|nr:uncharacterized protein LOC126894243 [Daktulosphaira vitifoliae]XP_050521065.1 uncharacterized protein LOC126894243 [Daktulosphaira vitifoliae]XP_050521066.1 uncharacterized protein LOC126894243 [Daktulosphaira vitifoliae]XP_050521067.1 uncharacterized protein LOC126894243 [Daktulosphaira vitifoliae]